ncbi:MAG: cyclase family protein [Pseudomonadota bacterium]|nr:cyclase family protein [Pseudomonadota bacterium]
MTAGPDWIDVTVPIRDGMLHWPGDPDVRVERVSDLDRGDAYTLSKLSLGAHTGTHVDAPLHYVHEGRGVDELPLDALVGDARVIRILDPHRVTVEELLRHDVRTGERVLFRTRNSDHPWPTEPFSTDYVHLAPDAAAWLALRGVRTVGIDYLSVASPEEGTVTHRALLLAGVVIVEGLDLSRVPAGRFQFVCLPLKLQGCEGAPARVLLRPVLT